jgi:hypothetical protein
MRTDWSAVTDFQRRGWTRMSVSTVGLNFGSVRGHNQYFQKEKKENK